MIIPSWIYSSFVIHLSTILSAFIITYARVLGKDFYWVIDDLDGTAKYSDKWDEKEQKVIDTFDISGLGADGNKGITTDTSKEPPKLRKCTSFVKELGFPGNILKFIRLNIGKKHTILAKNSKGHDVWGFVQSPVRHHLLSMTVHAINLVLGYTFLRPLIGENLAFASCLLYSVHPLTTQTVAWISGINYSLSLMFALIMFNLAMFFKVQELYLPLIAFASLCSTFIVYIGGFSCFILLFLGYKLPALISAIVGLGIIFYKGQETKSFRVKAFKEQNMEHSTSFNLRKPIVMVKTLWYYMRCVFLPIKMGLYHVWGYFYEEPIERINGMFWLGVLTILGFIGAFVFGDTAIRLGIVWFFSYFIIFSNFMTAQQFVADRYVTIPAFGICMILASVLYGTPFFWILLGLYMMRTFLHLPTFKNEIDFYGSNFLNFRKSEVALGNLGVGFINQGMHGAAVDIWMLATKINPHYDVPWYNLYSIFKGNGRFAEARDFLKKCLDAKVVHFESRWANEMKELDSKLELIKNPVQKTELFYHEAADHYKAKDLEKEHQALKKYMAGDTAGLLPEMTEQVKARLAEIESSGLLMCHPVSGQSGPQVTGPNPVDPKSGVSAGSN